MSTGARNRAKGKLWERTLRDGFRRESVNTEHHRDTGTKDEGDLIVRAGEHIFVIEAKDAKLNVTGFINEAKVERDNFLESRKYYDESNVHSVVAWKRKGMTFRGGVFMMDKDNFISLLQSIESLSRGNTNG